ncbi:MAG: beta-N-acetylhexosaminidase [Elusimicrobia bacterium]|nr:beta-N-acetylhexosaminidase [Elusimicrobiota bacterium]
MKEMKYFINSKKLPNELKQGIKQLYSEYPISFEKSDGSKEIYFSKNINSGQASKIKVYKSAKTITVNYSRKTDAFRALGRLFGEIKYPSKSDFSEKSQFEMTGVMLESSRNGVLTVANVKAFLRRFALMGINVVLLYTEDTYEVPGEPFFGYLRGKYTQKELRVLDDYAYNLGIEMFPCIQTLAHLSQILQWSNAYGDVTDTDDILLVGEQKTYKLLRKMISAACAPYRSKRIHIGMDEAHGLGTGRYLKLNGHRRTFDIMNEHLTKVCNICKHLGLKPMIWSDMFFRMGSKNKDYYDLNTKIPQDVIDNIPNKLELVYWDYHHKEAEFYKIFIDMHRRLGKEPIVAPGAWNWNCFWSNLPFAYSRIEQCVKACREKNVQQTFLTTWGDDGMESDIYSALPAVQFFAELAYSDNVDRKKLETNFYGSCKVDIESYELACGIDYPPCTEKPGTSNLSKWLLWDDLLIGLCEPQQNGQSFKKHYLELLNELKQKIESDEASKRLNFPMQIAKTLSIKCDCRKHLVAAYKSGDKKKLEKLIKTEVIPLQNEVKKLWQIHREMWLTTYKPFGLEVIEIRYGGLIARTESLISRIKQYVEGDINNIPEFETKLIKFQGTSSKNLTRLYSHKRITTPSVIFN